MRSLRYAMLAGVLAVWGCAPRPIEATRLIDPPALRLMVAGNTLLTTPAGNPPTATMLYLDPRGTGWYDDHLSEDRGPTASGMTMIFAWSIPDPSRLCVWTTPHIGEVPSQMPPSYRCLQILRPTPGTAQGPAQGPAAVDVLIAQASGRLRQYQATITAGNRFPAQQTDQFIAQMRVLFGGQMPVWQTAAAVEQPGS